jgi:hypothetical protein
MKLKDKKAWNEWVKNNKDPYGAACIKVAKRVMEILDENKEFDVNKIINKADEETKAGGLTGFMAGCVAQMVAKCHERGEEFRQKWNIKYQLQDEGEKANKGKGVLNPALLTIKQ